MTLPRLVTDGARSYGRYTDTLRSLDGTTYDIDVTGLLESMKLRS